MYIKKIQGASIPVDESLNEDDDPPSPHSTASKSDTGDVRPTNKNAMKKSSDDDAPKKKPSKGIKNIIKKIKKMNSKKVLMSTTKKSKRTGLKVLGKNKAASNILKQTIVKAAAMSLM